MIQFPIRRVYLRDVTDYFVENLLTRTYSKFNEVDAQNYVKRLLNIDPGKKVYILTTNENKELYFLNVINCTPYAGGFVSLEFPKFNINSHVLCNSEGKVFYQEDFGLIYFFENGLACADVLGKSYYEYQKLTKEGPVTFQRNLEFISEEFGLVYQDYQWIDNSLCITSVKKYEEQRDLNALQTNSVQQAMEIVNQNPLNYFKLNTYFQKNQIIGLTFIRKYSFYLEEQVLFHQKSIEFSNAFHCLPEELLNSELIAREVLVLDGLNLQYFNSIIKSNRNIVNLAINQNVESIIYASDTLNNDRDFVLSIISRSPSVLEFLNTQWQDEEEVVKICVEKDGLLLQYASNTLRLNEEIVDIAVRENPSAVKYDLRTESEKNDDDLPF